MRSSASVVAARSYCANPSYPVTARTLAAHSCAALRAAGALVAGMHPLYRYGGPAEGKRCGTALALPAARATRARIAPRLTGAEERAPAIILGEAEQVGEGAGGAGAGHSWRRGAKDAKG